MTGERLELRSDHLSSALWQAHLQEMHGRDLTAGGDSDHLNLHVNTSAGVLWLTECQFRTLRLTDSNLYSRFSVFVRKALQAG